MEQQVFCVSFRKMYCKRNVLFEGFISYNYTHTHTQTHTSSRTTPTSDQFVAQTATYTTHYKHNRQKSMHSAGFEPAIAEINQLQPTP